MSILKPLRGMQSLALAAAALLLTSIVSAQDKSTASLAGSASAPPPAAPAPAPGVQQGTGLKVKLKTLEDWDNEMDHLGQLTARIYAGATSQDLGGQDLEYYWHKYVFTQTTKDTLDSLREKAKKQSVAKDTAGLQHTLDEGAFIMSGERAKAYDVMLFLRAQQPVIYHQYQLGPWLTRATDQDRQGINDRVRATYALLLKQLDEAIKLHDVDHLDATTDSFFKLIAEPVAFFNAERERLVKAQAGQPMPVSVSVPARTRGDKPCPKPVTPTKGRTKPGLAPNFPSSESFYPAIAKQNDVEGSVTLRVSISETGCIQRAEVAGTSGVARLDESALDLAMAGNYVPAAGAGDKPAAGTLMFRVKFEQPDAFGSPAGESPR